jgi:cell division septal protein FtsQ
MNKRLLIALFLLLILSTYKPQNLSLVTKFNIKKIIIENNFILKDEEIKKSLVSIYEKNLIFLRTSSIKNILQEESFIKSFEVKKIYPNIIKIKIFEKKPLAIIQNKKKKFYLSQNIELIEYKELNNYNNLPIIFGDKDSFKLIYDNLKKIEFPFDTIKKFYLFEINRWDLETYENKIIKLPVNNYIKSLKNFMDLRKKNDFDKYKIYDFRIKNQLILK